MVWSQWLVPAQSGAYQPSPKAPSPCMSSSTDSSSKATRVPTSTSASLGSSRRSGALAQGSGSSTGSRPRRWLGGRAARPEQWLRQHRTGRQRAAAMSPFLILCPAGLIGRLRRFAKDARQELPATSIPAMPTLPVLGHYRATGNGHPSCGCPNEPALLDVSAPPSRACPMKCVRGSGQ